uniref:Transposase DDE domain-containing protein n=1 Tax=Candidatus Kentrum eta TaxID=2126337 RepID=A0A450VML2_9GAMM|nr:MAG: hypothetical protein BECKH772A_GA0070896_101072 [Candidatus Kentron sp. H]VFK06048.1 MAG: hypothetical protein BECKH772C_GA0070978_103232 [Candidatus Kentron sp. H]
MSLFQSEIMINIGILHEPGHKEPWIIAYSSRRCIWPMFSDFKSRGFGPEDTRIEDANRIHNLILVMVLAIIGVCASGMMTPLTTKLPRKKAFNMQGTITGLSEKHIALRYPGFREDYAS